MPQPPILDQKDFVPLSVALSLIALATPVAFIACETTVLAALGLGVAATSDANDGTRAKSGVTQEPIWLLSAN